MTFLKKEDFMKKMLVFLLGLTLLLIGCGGKNGKDEKIVIKYALWDSVQAPIYRELADKFEKENPNIKVEFERTPYNQYWTKLQAATSGGQMPDIVWMNGPNFLKYASYNMLLPLDKMIKKDSIDMDKYVEGIKNLYQYKGEQYGIPKDVDSIALWYNKDIFDKAGLKYPTNQWTWDDMKKAAIKIQRTIKGVYGVAIPVYEDQSSYYNVIPQNGGRVISKDRKVSGYGDENTIKAIEMLKDLFDEKATPDYTTMLENKATKMFQSEQVAMIYQGSWRASPLDADEKVNKHLGVVTMPKIKNNSTVVHGVGYAIAKSSKHPEAAWKFIKYLTSKESNDYVAKSGIVIPAYIESQKLWSKNYKNIDVSAYIKALENNVAYPVSFDTAKWSHVQDVYLTKVWSGAMSPKEACKNIKKEMDSILKSEK